MNRKPAPVLWMGVAFGVAAVLAFGVLASLGADPKSIGAALRLTARWSFLLFWAAYAGGPIAALFGPAFAPLARRGRDFGLAFAAAHLIHLALVAWLYRISPHAPLSTPLFVFFAIGVFWVYLLAAMSFGGLAQAIGPRAWRAIRILGMNYILLAFARDFVPPAIHFAWANPVSAHFVAYAPFAAMSIAAPLLYLASIASGHRRISHAAA